MTLAITASPSLATQVAPVVPPEAEDASVQILYHKFTVDDYHRMLDIGILSEDDRAELIDGEVRAMCAIDPIHAAIVNRFNNYLSAQIADRAILSVQNPVRLHDYTEPLPDLALLRWQDDFYAQRHPLPEDVLIIIEVANTSLVYDRKEKLPRYAAAGIPEVWLVNIARQTVEQYATPANGQYTYQQVIGRGQALTTRVINDIELSIDRIFGRQSS